IQHQSLTAFLNDPLAAADYKHAMACVNELNITYQAGKLIEMDVKMVAKKGVSATLTPATNTENVFTPKNFSVKLAANQAGLAAASVINVRSLKLKIAKALEHDDVLGSNDPADFLNKTIEITGDIEAIWQDEASFKTAFLAGTEQAMRIDLKNADVTIATSANPELQIDLYKVSFDSLTRPFKVGDTVMQTISFKAHYSLTDSKMVSVKLTNLQASY
ncbi:MAG: phage tail tube protein, partial [Patescibacteria group bacterium]|nr:phage tail tube protein [Patescibacteria group bacterium]